MYLCALDSTDSQADHRAIWHAVTGASSRFSTIRTSSGIVVASGGAFLIGSLLKDQSSQARTWCSLWHMPGCQHVWKKTHWSPRVPRPRLNLLHISLPDLEWVSLLARTLWLAGLGCGLFVLDGRVHSLDMMLGLLQKDCPFLVRAQM